MFCIFICRMHKRRFTCTICTNTFSRRYRQISTFKTVMSIVFLCKLPVSNARGNLPQRFEKKNDMRTSFINAYYNCSRCEKSFSVRSNLAYHQRVVHGAQKLQCPTCQRQFSYASVLKGHRSEVREQQNLNVIDEN